MKFVCHEHDRVEPVKVDGYVLGHSTERGEPNELDLEGVEFKFTTDDDNSLEVSTDHESYMSKFSNWEEVMIKAVQNVGILDSGGCPECGKPVWLLEDDEEKPEP